MKKKLFTLGLAATLGLSMGTTVFAEENRPVGAPITTPIPSAGNIGLGTGNEGGDFTPSTQVSVSIPVNANWYVSEQTGGEVRSGNFRITNQSDNANLKVTFNGYNQLTGPRLDELTLNLTGHLAADGLGQDITNEGNDDATGTFNSILNSIAANSQSDVEGDTWTFSFGGNFVGNIPATALTPTFALSLTFEVDSYTVG